jgi:hypothetical protein
MPYILQKFIYFENYLRLLGGGSKTLGRSIGDRRGPDKNFSKIF